MKTLQILCAFTCVALFIAGCDSSSSTSQPTPKVYAGTNSTFIYKKNYKDASGNVSGSDTTKTATVVQGPHSYGGKDTTITVVEDARDTTIMSYEANGNVSIYRGNGVPGAPVYVAVPTWWTLPVRTKDSLRIMDSTVNVNFTFSGINVSINKIKGDAVWRGSQTLTVGSESLAAEQADVTFIISGTISGFIPVSLTFNTSYLYSAKIGYFAKYDTQNKYPQAALDAGLDPGNSVQVLTNYSLQ